MKIGIKIGPDCKKAKARIKKTNPEMCEVWFDINRAQEYNDVFQHIKTKSLDVGLHYWGALHDGTMTTLASNNADIRRQSFALMKQTIDIAAQNNFTYVNIHPGTRAHVIIDFTRQTYVLKSRPYALKHANGHVLHSIQKLNAYALAKNVVLTVETVPLRVYNKWHTPMARLHTQNIYEMPIETIHKLARAGISIANDFGHTAGSIISKNPDSIWQFVYNNTKKLAHFTKLIHVGFILPPYNGTDMHDTLENPNFEKAAAVPNKNQMIELFSLFEERNDIWVLCEPEKNHVTNYIILQALLRN